MASRGDLSVHRWVLERSLLQARRYGQRIEAERIRKLMAAIDRRRR